MIPLHGNVAPGFDEVRSVFARNFHRYGELGAACAVWWRGEMVVDLWGGYRDRNRQQPWQRDTLVPIFSTTKGISAITLALAHSRGLLDYDERVCCYWPEFAQNGKESITVRQLLAHQAGLCALDVILNAGLLADLDRLGELLARQRPAWQPGTRHGYHGITLGFFQNELLRRIDSQHRSIRRFFQEEIAGPLKLDIHYGIPAELSAGRVAELQDLAPWEWFLHMHRISWRFLAAVVRPSTLTFQALRNPYFSRASDIFTLEYAEVELPSSNAVADARSIACLFGIVAAGGKELNLQPATFAELVAPSIPPSGGDFDLVMRRESSYALGFSRPSPSLPFSQNPQAFGAAGIGGSFAFGDPTAQLGFAYLPSRCRIASRDPRERDLRLAVQRCIEKMV
ncbi:MAG TPA: serine hydrolase domain-containing protein [Gemmataceae bacterium]|jgi:CubicO group peptidase (beta-lactamase class C family)|nr:serine hydrolase domain-containing protein [Gemmataceae bacterium]